MTWLDRDSVALGDFLERLECSIFEDVEGECFKWAEGLCGVGVHILASAHRVGERSSRFICPIEKVDHFAPRAGGYPATALANKPRPPEPCHELP
jgi:hypothetical protein